MEIFKLVGSIMVDSKDAEESISKTGEQATSLHDKLSAGIGTAASWAKGVVSGAVQVGKAMVDAAKETASNLDVIDKASIRMGVSAESYQELAYAAGLCGVEMTTMEKAAKQLEGTDLSLDDALNQLMQIDDETERTQAAVEMFGEAVAYKMEPLLQSGADGLASMKQEANDLGLVMSQEVVSDGAAMNDMFSKIEQSLDTLKTGLMSEFMPYLMEIMQKIIDNIPQIKETISGFLDSILPIVQPVVETIIEWLGTLIEIITTVLNGVMPVVEPIIQGLTLAVTGMFSLLTGDTETFSGNFKRIFEEIGPALFQIGKDIMNSLWNGLVEVWNSLTSWFSESISSLWQGVTEGISGAWNTVTGWFGHAGGISEVPYDNYPAMLHKGESVLTQGESEDLRSIIKALANNSNGNSSPMTIIVQSVLDGKVIGETAYKYSQNRARAYG